MTSYGITDQGHSWDKQEHPWKEYKYICKDFSQQIELEISFVKC